MRTVYACYSNSLPSVQWTPLLAVTVECVWVTVQTKVNRCISPRKRQKKRGWEEDREGEGKKRRKDEGGNVTGECDSVMQAGFIVSPNALGRSLAHNMESINPHRIPLSLPDTCLSASMSVFLSRFYVLFIDVLDIWVLIFDENLVSRKCVASSTP